MHILYGNDRIQIQVSLKLVPKGPVEDKAALILVFDLRRKGDKPLPEPIKTKSSDAYMR